MRVNGLRLLLGILVFALVIGFPLASLLLALESLGMARKRREEAARLAERISRLEAELQALRAAGTVSTAGSPVTPEPGPTQVPEVEPIVHEPALEIAEPPGTLPELAPSVEAPTEPPVTAALPQPATRAPRLDIEQRIGARWTTWVGVIAILFAVAFFLRWSIENNLIGPGTRVVLGVITGSGLLAGGLLLHRRRDLPFLSEGFAGGGLSVLYLSLYAAYNYYGFLGSLSAFALMLLVTVAGSLVSVVTRRQATAVLATLGGLLTPILVATPHPDERVLLGYLLVLGLMVLGVAVVRSWPGLNRIAWTGSVLLVVPVFARRLETDRPVARLVLMSALFALYLAVPLIRAWIERKPSAPPDLVLLVGNAVAYFGGVYVTLETWVPKAEGPYAAALAALYVLAAVRHRARVPDDRPTEVLLTGLSVSLLTLAFPLALDGPWVTLGWAALAVTLFWTAAWVPKATVVAGGLVLLGLAAARAAILDPSWYVPPVRVWNVYFLVHLLVIVAFGLAGEAAARIWPGRRESTELRSFLRFAGAVLLAALLWREPTGLWPGALLGLEMLASAWLAKSTRDVAFRFGTAVMAALLLARVFVEDAHLARAAAATLVNGPLLLRLAACGALAVAGRWLNSPGASPQASALGRTISVAGACALPLALSLAWINHQRELLEEAVQAGARLHARRIAWRLQVGLSILWTLYGAGVLAWGFVRKSSPIRFAALAVLGGVILKVFLIDLSELQTVYRILSFLVLGVVLLGVSFLYQKLRK
jgi:uncharacterized membrane protein